jgi:hypothetical protein
VAWDNRGAALTSSLAKLEAHKIGERTKIWHWPGRRPGGIKIGGRKLGLDLRQKDCQRTAKGEIRYALSAEGGSPDILPVRSNSTHEKEHEEDDQNDANDTDAAVTVAIAVAAEPATEATNQEDDENDDKNQSQW